MIGSALVARVQKVIDDPSFDSTEILGYINEGLFDIASLIDIPDLVELGTVETATDADYVSLPDDYMRKVTRVESVTNEVNISAPDRLYEYLKFRRRHPFAESGYRATDVAIRENVLHYYPTPEAAETLQLSYLKNPTEITLSTAPTYLPSQLHAALLVSFAARIIFEFIEDGIEGPQVNTDRQEGKYQKALVSLRLYVGAPDSEPVFVADEDDLDG